MTFKFSGPSATSAGSHAITPGGLTSDNYDISFASGTLTVGRAVLLVKAEDKTKTYGGAAVPFTVTYDGFVNGEGPSALGGTLAFNFTDSPATSAGSHAITPGGLTSDNYEISFVDGTLTVTRATPTITWG